VIEDKDSLEYRFMLFKENTFYKWKPPERRIEKPVSSKGRKPLPSKRILNIEPQHNKWWRT
jgi:hypothetical protein